MPITPLHRPVALPRLDAALGDPLGKMELKPHAYAAMTQALMGVRDGKEGGPRVLSCLEGGYNLKQIPLCCEAMVRTQLILVDKQQRKFEAVEEEEVKPAITKSTLDVLDGVRNAHLTGPWKTVIENTEEGFKTWMKTQTPKKDGRQTRSASRSP